MKTFKGRTAVITGAASGFGLESSRIAARARHERRDGRRAAGRAGRAPPPRSQALGAQVLPFRLDVAKAAEVEALGAATVRSVSARRTSSSTTPASAPAA